LMAGGGAGLGRRVCGVGRRRAGAGGVDLYRAATCGSKGFNWEVDAAVRPLTGR